VLSCRLGHREQKDEWLPRRVDIFQKHNVLPPDAIISAGSVNSACTAGTYLHFFPLNWILKLLFYWSYNILAFWILSELGAGFSLLIGCLYL